jgi:hypothetical protein
VEPNYKESRQARIERTLSGTGPVLRVGKLLTAVKNGKTLAQRLAAGEEIERDALDFPYPLHEQFRLSLQSIWLWGCPFCGSAHGSGIGVSRSVSVPGLEGNQFYYNPLTQQLFSISATCLRKQSVLAERFVDELPQNGTQSFLSTVENQMVNRHYPQPKRNAKRSSQQESYWVRKSIAFMVACYCGMVVYSRFLLRGKNP